MNLLRQSARIGACLILLAACALVGQAQTAPYALFQSASLTGSGNTITATGIPVVIAPNLTVYVNLNLQFNVDVNGNLTISQGYPQIIPAPTILSSGFKAGTYAGPGSILGGKALITVSGPGVTDGGATEWSLSSAAGADPCTYPYSATWYVGPIANNPYAAWLKSDGITSTAYSYGVGSASNSNGCSNSVWYLDALIGVSQVGNTITIVSFGDQGGQSNSPEGQITYTLQQ
ncbi:MAG: hypothetical protein ABSB15_11695 [Bryobacteraceae bacterium]